MDIELKSDPQFYLSQTLACHQLAVRSLTCTEKLILSGSTDKIAKLFALSNDKAYEQINEMDFYTNYIYAVCQREGGGFAVASGQQIFLHDMEGNPVGVLDGHQGMVCSLSSKNSKYLVSGSWDATAIIWDLETQSVLHRLEGHKYGVAVLATDDIDEILTGSQDGVLRHWVKGKQVKTVDAHSDIIREICDVTNIGYLTCSNDETLKLWSKDLQNLATFLGHTGFIFSSKYFSIGGIPFYVSGSDDNSVKLWKNLGDVVQTINHPGCVWTVAVNPKNGDIITGCADGKIRVFTCDVKRKAPQDQIDEYDKEVELAVAQGPEGLSQDQLNKMEPVENLANVKGKKQGEVKMFRNGAKPEVYAWDGSTWQKIGDVVGGTNKKQYHGDQFFPAGEYDYIFDVEDDSGVSKKIPVNDGDNHLDVAERFCKREGYNKAYLGQVMNFLKQNTKPPQQKKVVQTKNITFECIPFTVSIFYESMNLDGLQKKLAEFNTELANTSDPLALTLGEINQFNQVVDVLKQTSFYHTSTLDSTQLALVQNKLLRWPSKYLVPVYDFLRIIHLHHSSEKLYSGLDSGINIFTQIGVFIQQPNQTIVSTRLCVQTLTNLFKQNANVFAALRHMQTLTQILSNPNVVANPDDRLSLLLANLILNYSIAAYQKSTIQPEAGTYLGQFIRLYLESRQRDSECLAKAATAVGNLSQSGDLQTRKQVKAAIGNAIKQIQIVDNENGAKCVREVLVSLDRV